MKTIKNILIVAPFVTVVGLLIFGLFWMGKKSEEVVYDGQKPYVLKEIKRGPTNAVIFVFTNSEGHEGVTTLEDFQNDTLMHIIRKAEVGDTITFDKHADVYMLSFRNPNN